MFRNKRVKQYHIEADEVFLDSKNLPHFDKQQFEGKLEKPLSKNILYLLMSVVALVCLLFIIQLYRVQVLKGDEYFLASTNNALEKELVFASRGVIYDRNEVRLAWNEENPEQSKFLLRKYFPSAGFSHILGYVKYPKKDAKGYFWRTEYTGLDGIEKQFNDVLSGVNGARIIETSVSGEEVSSNIYEAPVSGENVTLSIDSEIQGYFYDAIKQVSDNSNYIGGSGMLVDLKTGEILSLVNYPEYDSNIMTESRNEEVISGYFQNTHYPLLNRAISGIYTPGSIVKPFVGIGALVEGVITPSTRIASIGSISLPNPYNPGLSSVFRDLRPNNGVVNIKEALSVSSNIFFYNVGGGFQGQPGIGITKIGEYWKLFGLAEKTNIELPGEAEGNIPSVDWKKNNFPNDPTWRVGDTYNTAIGQYGVQVTPIQMLHAVSLIATEGKKIPFTILKKDGPLDQASLPRLDIAREHFVTIKDGMRLAVTSPLGTGKGLNSLNDNFAVKTGTAQVGANNQYINTWIMGFFPYEEPRYAFVVLMDKGHDTSAAGAPTASLYFFQKFQHSEFYKNRE